MHINNNNFPITNVSHLQVGWRLSLSSHLRGHSRTRIGAVLTFATELQKASLSKLFFWSSSVREMNNSGYICHLLAPDKLIDYFLPALS